VAAPIAMPGVQPTLRRFSREEMSMLKLRQGIGR
jgi:hypothetical protein